MVSDIFTFRMVLITKELLHMDSFMDKGVSSILMEFIMKGKSDIMSLRGKEL